ncbi:tetratricopeptide repeat protein [candidate division CSSED10-310 bacterium]|uniref:Tetratricopeptide repeat protein n=1 Tax=candidate division CSSED10-310 bacterium TaxID=2855610 RepID=A0ABV6Z2Y4_UNCC1
MTSPQIGSYHILHPLGQGGMGVVHKARHQETGEVVALKTIRVVDEMQLESIRREVRALARIKHPGIVRIVAEGVQDGLPWYAMDFVEGMTLRQYITRQQGYALRQPIEFVSGEATPDLWWTGNLGRARDTARTARGQDHCPATARAQSVSMRGKLSQVLPLVSKLCSPLAFLHGEGIVHRDLKPENIMVTRDGTPIVVDFGLMTRFTGEESREILTVEYGAVGTVSYMAPEQIQGEFVDARADMYALGCILYELLVGHPPFIGVNSAQIIQAHLHGTPAPPSRFRPEVQTELDDLVSRLMTKDPRERIGHADVVATSLIQLSDDKITIEGPKPKTYLYRARCTGRETAMEKLRRYSRELKRNRGGFLFIGGESGIGKTRLVMEFGRELAREGVMVLTGECSEIACRPLEAFLKPLQAIADRCRERGLEETERLLGRRGKVFALYEPAMIDLPGQEQYPEPAELPPDAAKLRLYSYLSETFRELSTPTPVALLLDDLQWTDELSLGFFEYECRINHLTRAPIVMIGTYRSESVEEELHKIIDTSGVERINLGRLDDTSIATMVGDMLGMSPPPGSFSQYLSLQSAGNPLFVSEYLRVAIDIGLLSRNEQGAWQLEVDLDNRIPEMDVYEKLPIPTSLQGLIERRLESLSDNARAPVEAAAIVGREVSILLLWEMTGLDDEELLIVVDALLQHQILEKSSSGTVRFSHGQIRDISLSQLGRERRKELHRSAAESIELVYARQLEQYQAELGMHWVQAGDTDKAKSCYLSAARRSRDRYDHKEAVRLYSAYLNLVTSVTKEYLTVRCERGDVLQGSGHYDAALEDYAAACDKTDDEEMLTACRRKEAFILQTIGDISGARQAYHEALMLSEIFPLEQARILNEMAYFEGYLQSNYKEAENICKKAHDLVMSLYPSIQDYFATSSSDFVQHRIPRVACQVLAGTFYRFGVVHYTRGNLDRALEFHQKSLAICEEIGDRQGIGTASNNIGNVYHARGNLDRALVFHQKSLTIGKEIDDRQDIGKTLCNIGRVYHARGNLDQAIEFFQKSLAIFEEIGDRRNIGTALCNIGNVYHAHGNLDRALEFYQKYLAIDEKIGDRRGIGMASGNIGNVYLAYGDLDLALEFYQRSLAIFEEIGDKPIEAEAMMELSETHRIRGDLPRALKLNSQAMEIFTEVGNILKTGDCWCRRAECDIDRGNFSAAHDSFTRAKEIYEQIKGGEYSWRIPLIKVRLTIAKLGTETDKHRSEKTEQVVEQARNLVEEAHDNPRIPFKIEAPFRLGMALKAQGASEDAQASLEQALALARKYGYGLLERQIMKVMGEQQAG